jgi:D-alanyl-D-alanine carboxypeptidase
MVADMPSLPIHRRGRRAAHRASLPLALLVLLGTLLSAPPARAASFSDIAGSPFRPQIEWLAGSGITGGCGGGKFCPRAAVTRAQMASFLVRMYGYVATPTTDPFRDDDGSPHERDIERLAAAGITGGCAAGRFCPAQAVRRAEMATFLVRAERLAHGAGSDHFADDDGSVHEGDLDRLAFAGIGAGCGVERACPLQPVTREQMAAFLFRAVHAAPIGAPGLTEHVTLPQPAPIAFDGPRRWRGVAFSADGTTAILTSRFGTIPDRSGTADQAARFNGIRYVRMASGPLTGSWVKIDDALTTALGRAAAPPPCSYQDLPTTRTAYDQWPTTLLDTIYLLPVAYAPGDRVSTANAGLNGGHTVRSLVQTDLAAMVAAARAAGAPLQVASAYRSYQGQIATFQHWVDVGGLARALRTSARPGHSEHQLGTTIDFTSLGGAAPWQYRDWGTTAAGGWMAANAWRYGFVMSYPRGSFAQSCYEYEPWHFRYVGRETAAAVRASGMTLREAIWAAYGP